jgi:hypothetical protein
VTSYIDIVIHRYLFRKNKPVIPPKLKLILSKTPEVQKLMNKECPWCGRKFKSRRNLSIHLKANGHNVSECSLMYMQLLNNIASTYNKVKYEVIRKRDIKSRPYYVKPLGTYFKTLEEAYEAWLRCTT